ncbi:NAD(P)/FAD-dependent oxidoreductase [Nocardioides marmoriginsengisoli]|uniref:NAD(P)/FAD-dependent oxidoreductase n=1 Tax=Nocardioides marmoriginsengisoli TaxID=661483 RepID=A0A3N0CL73_9ACTN|nr:NAD(P)/FAD-dependent oxidoreductase [Nocardioides marmoriginsengisoli]RNL64207.1 NAD(P)/FAD-dependent oxidoreductase [Nocardioides marmoriginsengisoli]
MTSTTSLPERVRVLVVGAGFAGLGAAIKLDEAGQADFLVLDKGTSVGGTWRDNTYPGAACDVPSQLYSFSFAPNPNWSRSFSPQPEIHAYLQDVARSSGVLDRFRFGVTVEDAAWDETDQVWTVTTSAGTVTADVVISGSGGLSEPKNPEIKGIDGFTGEIFHTARWDHDVDLAGKRVAIIGTGASAIQVIPEIAKTVGHLDVYQRTAPWVMPRHDRAYTRVEKLGFRFLPGLQKLYRTAIYWGRETYVPGFVKAPAILTPAKTMALANIKKGISDPELQRKVTPDFQIGCKRILISNTYYPALAQANVDVITDGIAEITPTGIVTSTGETRDIDVLIVATGFYTTDQPIAHHIKGRDGRTLGDVWAEHGMASYKGTTAAGFPNLFQIVGANTGLGHSSMVFMIESQIAYILDALAQMGARQLATVEPTPEAQKSWNEDMQRRMRSTVWSTGGCASWYLDEHGRNTTLWPRTTFAFRGLLRSFDIEKYVVTARSDAPVSKANTEKESVA